MTDEQEREIVWDVGNDDPPVVLPLKRHPVANAVLTVCGLIAMASPLALWISWTEEILINVFVLALVCIAVCWGIVAFDPE
jgi:hypothetical protein